MPKQLINTIGMLVVAGIIAASALLVGLPLYLQSLAVDAQTGTVAAQNAGTQAQIDSLASQDVTQVQADAKALREQIPASPRLDTVSSLIASAAAAHGVTVISFTPAAPEDFAAPGATAPQAPAADGSGGTSGDQGQNGGQNTELSGTLQVPVELEVTGPDLNSVLAFLDAVREGPRLLGSIEVTYSARSGDSTARIKALAFTATDQQAAS